MEFNRLLEIVGNEPVFETSLLLVGDVRPPDVARQLSRWTRSGRLHQLRRGLYSLAPPFQRAMPHPFVVANRMVRGSYVSAQSALAHYGLIPEHVPVVTSVTTGRPGHWATPLGRFEFRHIKKDYFLGFLRLEVGKDQEAYVASPEKAVLDLVHLHPGGDGHEYLRELRLQNLENLNLEKLKQAAAGLGSPKLMRAVRFLAEFALSEAEEYEDV